MRTIERKVGAALAQDPEDSLINELPEHDQPRMSGNVIISAGAVIAVLLGIPSLFIGLFAAVGAITGDKLIAGSLGVLWGFLAVAGAYELNRRKLGWDRGRQYSHRHLPAATIAVSAGLAISGALHDTMPGLAVVPALSAILQANDGHDKRHLVAIHIAVLIAGLSIGIWLYTNGVIGTVWLATVEAWP